LIFKHAISTVVMARAPHLERPAHGTLPAVSPVVPAAPISSTSQG
jgi:hypothetical protein